MRSIRFALSLVSTLVTTFLFLESELTVLLTRLAALGSFFGLRLLEGKLVRTVNIFPKKNK